MGWFADCWVMHADVDVDIFYNSKKPVIGYVTIFLLPTRGIVATTAVCKPARGLTAGAAVVLYMHYTSCCCPRRVILLIAFLFAMSMVLLNLLIALMSDAASKVSLHCARHAFNRHDM